MSRRAAALRAARRDAVPALLIAGFVALAAIVAVTFWFTGQLRQDAAATQAVLVDQELLTVTQGAVRQAETGQRGYLLTGNVTYLQQYTAALPLLPPRLAALDKAVAQDGLDAQDVTDLTSLADEKMAELAHTVALYRAGRKAEALAVVDTGYGEDVMGQLRALVLKMQRTERARLDATRAADAHDVRLFDAFIVLGSVFSVLFVAAAIATVLARARRLAAAELGLIDANAALELKVAELDRIFTLSTDLLAVLDAAGVLRNVSPAWVAIAGVEPAQAVGRPLAEFLHPEDVAETTARIARLAATAAPGDAPPGEFETRLRRPDSTDRCVAWRAVGLPAEGLVFAVARDVTEERAREERLRQSQKMEVVGQLTGGIAHDFNNLLTVIMGSLELLARGLEDAAPRLRGRVENALEASRRAAALTHRLLAFSRRQPLRPAPLDINRLAAGMSDMLHRTLGETIAVEVVVGAGTWWAMADANQLENALLNLAVNARDAMPGGGKLTVETANAHLDEAYAARRLDVAAGQYVQIAVTDTGTGMSQEVLDKVFEPFFTTKPLGQGTGLGLAQVYGFIKQSHGHVTLYSELGHGTTVRLYLPRAQPRLEAPEASAAADTDAPTARGRGETVLVVEDEPGVRAFSAEVLRDHGYAVLEAETGAEALALFRRHPGIAMLFTDVVLAGNITGRVLADAVLAEAPETVVLFTTGYTRNAIIHDGKLDDGVHFIGKPFTAGDLARKVRGLLDAALAPADAGE